MCILFWFCPMEMIIEDKKFPKIEFQKWRPRKPCGIVLLKIKCPRTWSYGWLRTKEAYSSTEEFNSAFLSFSSIQAISELQDSHTFEVRYFLSQ